MIRCSSAASVSDAVIKKLADYPAFSDKVLRNMFQYAGGFTCQLQNQNNFEKNHEIRIVASVLNKIAHRGTPSPCSLELEEYVLSKAQDAGILEYSCDKRIGSIEYSCDFSKPTIATYLKAGLYPLLLLNDNEAEKLVEYHKDLCTPPESRFLDQLLSKFSNRRLALFFTPQRSFSSMGFEDHHDERVDFACEIPDSNINQWLKIVIEIDDSSHSGAQLHKDLNRDKSLEKKGWQVIRFPLAKQGEWDEKLNEISEQITSAITQSSLYAIQHFQTLPKEEQKAISDLIYLPIAEAQISSSVAHLLFRTGKTDIIVSDPQNAGIEPVIQSIQSTINEIVNIHAPLRSVTIRTATGGEPADIEYYRYPLTNIQDKVKTAKNIVLSPCPVSSDYQEPIFRIKYCPVSSDSERERPLEESLLYFLKNIFRKEKFREKQVEIITRALSLKPVIALLPTAAGKSLCYQISGLLQPGITFIVDPLRSLMIDQVKSLESMGIHRSMKFMSGAGDYTTSDREIREEGYSKFDRGEYYYIFSSPERLQIPDFITLINKNMPNIPYCVVDEAHCVSEWGHDFRLPYMNVWRRMGEGMKIRPVFLALTGTASQNTLFDIREILNIQEPDSIIRPSDFNRNELKFVIHEATGMNRFEKIAEVFDSYLKNFERPPDKTPTGGLVFTNFATGDLGVMEIAGRLRAETGQNIGIYSGKAPTEYSTTEWDQYKYDLQDLFKSNKISLITCTHGFGMGIDKPDIRFTIHSILPRSIEDFYQEAGRAGRDGQPATCAIIYVDQYPVLSDILIDTEQYTQRKIEHEITKYNRKNSDIIRNLWFWKQNFPSVNFEKSFLEYFLNKEIISKIKDDSTPQTIEISYYDTDCYRVFNEYSMDYTRELIENAIEKALYRLYIVRAISDYSKNYTDKKFIVDVTPVQTEKIYDNLENHLSKLVSKSEALRFSPKERKNKYFEASRDCGYALIDFHYEYIEKRRRRSMGHMLKAVQTGLKFGSERFREELIGYLEESEFTPQVKRIAKDDNPDNYLPVIIDVREQEYSKSMLIKLLGACRKELEEFPNNPGLLILSGICGIKVDNEKDGLIDIKNGFIILKRNTEDEINTYQRVEKEFLKTIAKLKADLIKEIEITLSQVKIGT